MACWCSPVARRSGSVRAKPGDRIALFSGFFRKNHDLFQRGWPNHLSRQVQKGEGPNRGVGVRMVEETARLRGASIVPIRSTSPGGPLDGSLLHQRTFAGGREVGEAGPMARPHPRGDEDVNGFT